MPHWANPPGQLGEAIHSRLLAIYAWKTCGHIDPVHQGARRTTCPETLAAIRLAASVLWLSIWDALPRSTSRP